MVVFDSSAASDSSAPPEQVAVYTPQFERAGAMAEPGEGQEAGQEGGRVADRDGDDVGGEPEVGVQDRPHHFEGVAAAQDGQLVGQDESGEAEQASAGLDRLSPEEVELFQRSNAAYQARFGFPFVICARLNKKEAILRAFPIRLQNSPEQEVKTALEEIFKIAELRLRDLIPT